MKKSYPTKKGRKGEPAKNRPVLQNYSDVMSKRIIIKIVYPTKSQPNILDSLCTIHHNTYRLNNLYHYSILNFPRLHK